MTQTIAQRLHEEKSPVAFHTRAKRAGADVDDQEPGLRFYHFSDGSVIGTNRAHGKNYQRWVTQGLPKRISKLVEGIAQVPPHWVFTFSLKDPDCRDFYEQPIRGYKPDHNGCELAFQYALDVHGLRFEELDYLHMEWKD